MNPIFAPDSFILMLSSAGALLALALPGLLFYGYLANRTGFENRGHVRSDWFGPWDTLAATLLGILFAFLIFIWFFGSSQDSSDRAGALQTTSFVVQSAIATEVIFISILVGIVLVLKVGGFHWSRSLGLRTHSFALVLGQAVLLLLLAYPLIIIVLQLWAVLIASVGHTDTSQQEAVRFLAESKSRTAKWVVAVQAVVFAPIQEELIFRGYLYGLARRHLGVGVGIVVTSALFAGIHQHLPSFGGLFVLAVCLTLAYEWTGSIFVPMTMHATFNLISVIALFQ